MGLGDFRNDVTVEFYCPGGSLAAYSFGGANYKLKMQHMILSDSDATTAISVGGNGTVILDDCDFANHPSSALDIEPNGPLNLVIKNSRTSNSGSGILLKPAAGGSINATFDHVVISQNTGGGVKIDTTNGPVTLDVTDSVVSNNGGNGINAVGNAGGQAIVSIKNSVIAKNGAAGVQANGVNAGVLISTTLLDQNAAGATSVVSGGNMFTYGNNDVVGSIGSGFTQTAQLH
jgi:hypothetical protein